MRIAGGGSPNVNVLNSDAGQYRNRDFVSAQDGAYMQGANQAAVAGKYSHIQLLNPAGSGVVALVDRVEFSTGAAGLIYFRYYDTGVTTLVQAWEPTLRGGNAGISQVRQDTNAAVLGTRVVRAEVLADTMYSFIFRYPVILAAAEGCMVAADTANTALLASFYGREVSA